MDRRLWQIGAYGLASFNCGGSVLVVDRCLWIGACESASFNRGGLVLGLTSDREWKEEFQMGNGDRV